jgi:hypothetical protein
VLGPRPKISEKEERFSFFRVKNAFPHHATFVPQNFSRKLYNVCTSHETTMSEEEEEER